MRTQTDVDGGKYCDLMEEIKRGIEVLTYFVSGGRACAVPAGDAGIGLPSDQENPGVGRFRLAGGK